MTKLEQLEQTAKELLAEIEKIKQDEEKEMTTIEVCEAFEELRRLKTMKEKYESGEYVWVHNFPKYRNEWQICGEHVDYTQCKPIHKKHADILDAYLKNNSVEIEIVGQCTNKGTPTRFIQDYQEHRNYRLKPKQWYENEGNFPCLVISKNNDIFKCEKYKDGVFFTVGAVGFKQEELRPATKEEVLSLLVEEYSGR